MEYRKGLLREALADSLRGLMLKKPFGKITIKQICDETGVIRATFYNYFEDKYACLEYAVMEDIAGKGKTEADKGNLEAAVRNAFLEVEQHKEFYRIAYDITGQNSFDSMVRNAFQELIRQYLLSYRKKGYMDRYGNDLLSSYYANSLEFAVHYFVFDRKGHTADAMVQMVTDLNSNLFNEFS